MKEFDEMKDKFDEKKDVVIYKDILGNYKYIEFQYDLLTGSRNDIQKYDYHDRIIYSKKGE